VAGNERPRGNKPVYIARAKQAPDSEVMVTIGAAWPFNEGDGLVVKLQMNPDAVVGRLHPRDAEGRIGKWGSGRSPFCFATISALRMLESVDESDRLCADPLPRRGQ
jgi:hypothetical protein